MIDLSFLHQLDRFSLIINKRITSNYIGDRPTQFTGRGLIFKDHAIYAPGEDFRAIDWRVYARSDKLFVKRYEEERNLTVHVIIDFSASMNFGDKTSKVEYASMLGIGYAYMAMKNNEKFVMSTFSDTLEVFRPRKGRKQLASMLEFLNTKKAKGLSNLHESLARYKNRINTKSLIIIISDFLYPIDAVRTSLHRFKDHDIRLIQVLDRVERDLSRLEGDFKLRDSESGGLLHTFISPFLRKRYMGDLQKHQDLIQEACDEVGARYFTFYTDTPVFDAFFQMMGRTAK